MAGRPAPSAAPNENRGRSRHSSPVRLPIVSTTVDAHPSRPRGTQHATPSATRARPQSVAGSTGRLIHPASVMPGQVDLLSVAMKGLLLPCLDSPTRHQETLRADVYSVPAPTGETTGSFCARMRAKGCRPQPRHGSSAIAATADGFDDGHALHQRTGGVLLGSRRPRSSAPFLLPAQCDGESPPRQRLNWPPPQPN